MTDMRHRMTDEVESYLRYSRHITTRLFLREVMKTFSNNTQHSCVF